jgi:RimJ/RimL family protein N-acetyltransferase
LDYMIPWLEPEGKTLTIDFAIGEEAFLGKGLSSETLKKFAEDQEPSVSALLVDPEVKNEKAIHVYEKAGFIRVSTFIRGQGFFRGKPHYLLKMKIQH